MNITPEIRQAIERSGGEPLRLEDPLNCESSILLKASAFERIQRLLAPLISKRDDWQWADAYTAADEAFRAGWEAPGMSDYDEYKLRPRSHPRLRSILFQAHELAILETVTKRVP
jgi:hypothetical protein